MRAGIDQLIRIPFGVVAGFAIITCTSSSASTMPCAPLGFDREMLQQVKTDGYEIANTQRRARFATELLDCLGDPDPEIRDGIAFEGFVALLRGKMLQPESVDLLRAALVEDLGSEQPDQFGFRQPFLALVLAEVARADRIDPLFDAEERAELVKTSTDYMRRIDDYRGFDEREGWRHAVAHTADLLLQLVLNRSVTEQQLIEIRDAVGSQISPRGEHFYVYGESDRLARPILYMAVRGAFTEEQWIEWFEELAAADPFEEWGEVYSSQEGLAKLHNTRAFAEAVYVQAIGSEKEEIAALAAGALVLLRALP